MAGLLCSVEQLEDELQLLEVAPLHHPIRLVQHEVLDAADLVQVGIVLPDVSDGLPGTYLVDELPQAPRGGNHDVRCFGEQPLLLLDGHASDGGGYLQTQTEQTPHLP